MKWGSPSGHLCGDFELTLSDLRQGDFEHVSNMFQLWLSLDEA